MERPLAHRGQGVDLRVRDAAGQIRRRRLLTTAALATGEGPGLAMTAALATGDGPGLTADVTTAALATRDALMGISGSFGCCGGFIGLDGGDDGLGRDTPVGHQLGAGPTKR